MSNSRHISFYDDAPSNHPIISKAQERRICAELCMSGLGGEPCGEDCLDVMPQALLSQESQSDGDQPQVDRTTKDACPVLCANRLGYPLCDCNYTQVYTPFFRVDFLRICSQFCKDYNYSIYGCDDCQVYKNMSDDQFDSFSGISANIGKKSYFWNAWCAKACQEGDGGSACYCDLPPLALHI